MVDSVDNGCSIAFDPIPEPPTDEEGTLIPQTLAQVRALTILQDKWKLADRVLETHMARVTPQRKGSLRNRTEKMPEMSMPL